MVKTFRISKAAVIWLGLVAATIMAIVVYYAGPGNDFKDAPNQIGKCNDPAVSAVVYSIQSHPDRWDSDHYTMWHGHDVSIWIANKDYGLAIGKGRSADPESNQMPDECRSLLYDTTQTWMRNNLNAELRT